MAAATRYWVISLPVSNSPSHAWSRLQEAISKRSFDTPLYRFNTPDLRVGTLDSLLSLSDDLSKSNTYIEGVSHKIRRQIEELERVSGVDTSTLTVDGVPVDSYLTRFVWDEGRYPTMSPLKDIVGNIHTLVAKIEDDMKVRAAEYNTIRSQLNAINRKQSGSLAVRDLSDLVKPEDIIESEHLETLLAVVPKYSQKEWLSSYETLTTFVVPRSSKLLYEDNEYALYSVTLFRKVADNFRTSARERGFQTRDFEYSPEAQEGRKQELEKLMQDQENLRSSLLQWCYASYGEVFSSWMHFCAVRLFAESILRYGLPPSFLGAVLAPSVKSEKKVRTILEELSGSSTSSTSITGLNNNEYQISRGMELNNLAGLSGSCNFVKADFMKMLSCYKEILRVLKPGQCFAAYEWCMTEHYDPDNESHRQTKAEIELGNGLLDVRLTSQCLEALKLAGFEVIWEKDLALDSPVSWYLPLDTSRFSITSFSLTTFGRFITRTMVKTLEYVRLTPEGSHRVSSFLEKAAERDIYTNVLLLGEGALFWF